MPQRLAFVGASLRVTLGASLLACMVLSCAASEEAPGSGAGALPDVTVEVTWGYGADASADGDSTTATESDPGLMEPSDLDASGEIEATAGDEGGEPSEAGDTAGGEDSQSTALEDASELSDGTPETSTADGFDAEAAQEPLPETVEATEVVDPPDGAECSIDAHCDDDVACTSDSCATDGVCHHVKAPDAAPCDNGDTCTENDYCMSGICFSGNLRNCNDDNPCTSDSCAEGQGCLHLPKSSGPCDDGDPCTGSDHCANGVCVAGSTDLCPVCGDEVCGVPYESCADCPEDCGPCDETDCANSLDDDGDGDTDCLDSDCTDSDDCVEHDCANGLDDDGDGSTDCLDSDCADGDACIEHDCANGLDDDGDGSTDCLDGDCSGTDACVEHDCANGLDDDGDGTTDCLDSDCAGELQCVESDCGNGLDDDGDGATDCLDSDCLTDDGCVPAACAGAPSITCDQPLSGSPESNHLSGFSCGSLGANGDDIVYRFEVPAGVNYFKATVKAVDPEYSDYDLYLVDKSCQASACIDAGTTSSQFDYVSTTVTVGQTLYLVVEEYSGGWQGYELSLACE